MERWARRLRTIAFVAAAALALALVATRWGALYVAGRSMEPALRPGDLVVFSRGRGGLASDDIVVVRLPGWARPVVHRIVAVRVDGSVVTKGDANERVDLSPLPRSAVSGTVVVVVPLGRGIDALVRGSRWCYNRLPIANTRP